MTTHTASGSTRNVPLDNGDINLLVSALAAFRGDIQHLVRENGPIVLDVYGDTVLDDIAALTARLSGSTPNA